VSANTVRGKRQPNLTPKICNADYADVVVMPTWRWIACKG